MKKTLLCLSVLGMAGCAANPSDASAHYINPEPFMRYSCAQLAGLDQTDAQNLATARERQQVSQLKGELEAVHTAERGKNCVGRYSASDYDASGAITTPAGRLPPGSDTAYGYHGAGAALPSATTRPLQTTPMDISTGTGTGTGTGITTGSMPAQEGLSAPSIPSHAPTYSAPHYVVPPAGYTAPSYSGNPFQ
ncbi:hypothetical protein [Komagataeibacter xylinus]|uniref:hypothetical protein n=1 Tax=Komagataeibacter xylinus TaxID=28448 RepID=UPI00280B9504|nr:hypothetical protein [Komagataeibacter xylinus]